jgi:hypothetical protein
MDDAKVSQACRLLHEALCDDLELRRLLVQVDRDRVSLTILERAIGGSCLIYTEKEGQSGIRGAYEAGVPQSVSAFEKGD